jgi:hypothetical protein
MEKRYTSSSTCGKTSKKLLRTTSLRLINNPDLLLIDGSLSEKKRHTFLFIRNKNNRIKKKTVYYRWNGIV